MKETLAKEAFIDGSGDSDIRWKIYQARPKSLKEAVCIDTELEAFNLAEQKKGATKRLGVRTLSDKEPGSNGKTDTENLGGEDNIAAVMLKGSSDLTQHMTNLFKRESQQGLKHDNKDRQTGSL